jgi:cytochrome c biogenesis protein CcmG, thiol:disulfide interchange protein DsbE
VNLSVVALVAAICALIILALATGGDAPTTAGRDSAPEPAGGARDQIRDNLSDADAIVDDSLSSRLAALKGVPVVVNQWASWCPPCRVEFPYFRQMAGRYRERVAFLGLNSRDEREAAEAFLREHSLGFASVFDEDAAQARSIGAGASWPTTVFFDARGDAVLIKQGGYTDAGQLEADIRGYALGQP